MTQGSIWSVNWSAVLSASSGSIAVGDVVTRGTDGYVLANTANLVTGIYPRGMAVTPSGGGTVITYVVQGEVDASYTGLGTGASGAIYVSATGRLTRTPTGSSVGKCDTTGNAMLDFASSGSSLPAWLTAQTDVNTFTNVNPGVGAPSGQDLSGNETCLRFGASATASDRIDWGAPFHTSNNFGSISFGPEATVCPSGCLRFAGVLGQRTMLMGSLNPVNQDIQSIINISSAADGSAQSLEVGRDNFAQSLFYGGAYNIQVIDPVKWGTDSCAWHWEVEGHGYQYSMFPHLSAQFLNIQFGSLWNLIAYTCTARGTAGTDIRFQAGECPNGKGGDFIARGGYNSGGAPYRSGGFRAELIDDGALTFSPMIEMSEPVRGQRVVALCARIDGGITSTQMPTNTGDGVVYIGVAEAAPSANPVGGFILYVDPDDNKLKARGPSGTTTTLANP